MSVRRLGWVLLVVAAGCAETLPRPLTAGQLQQRWSGEALVVYLSQPDASPAACDLLSPGPGRGASISEDLRYGVVAGLVDGKIPPVLWRSCVDRLVRTAGSDSATLLLDRVLVAYGEALADRQLDDNPVLQGRVDAMQAVYLNRPSDRSAHPNAIGNLVAYARFNLEKGWLGPQATRHATALVEAVDIDRGWLRGRQIDRTTLDQLLAARDEAHLRQISQYVPALELRVEARRQVIRLHIQASSDPDLRSHAAAVEQTVMLRGANPISTGAHPPLRARLNLPVRQIWVRQQILAGTATVLGSAELRQAVSVLPELPLRRGIEVDVEGLARPVTICAPASALDPEPCLAASEITIASPLVRLDGDAVMHFVDDLAGREVARLAREEGPVVVPISVAGRRLAELTWELAFEKPSDLVLPGLATGSPLLVRVERRPGGRLLESVRANGADYLAVVEPFDAAGFHIVGRGKDGRSGSDGSSGSDGLSGISGSSASCPFSSGGDGGVGGDGSNGGDGGDGDRGSDGPAIKVEVACGGAPCGDLVALLESTVRSVGGRGGSGGRGGRGGRGGSGGSSGSGATCFTDHGTTSVSRGRDGLRGHDGLSGRDGSTGRDGAAGVVRVRAVNYDGHRDLAVHIEK